MIDNENGVLAIWHDITEGHQGEVLHWYDKQHHLERLSIPGFLSVRRYEALQGEPQVFIFYRTIAPEVLASSEYLQRVNDPTEWTRHCMQYFRNNSRTVCRRTSCSGIGDGGLAATLRFSPHLDEMQQLRESLTNEHLPELAARAGMCRAELWEADSKSTNIHTEERVLRSAPDHVTSWTIMLSGTHLAVVQQQAEALIEACCLLDACEEGRVDLGLYRNTFTLDAAIEFHNKN